MGQWLTFPPLSCFKPVFSITQKNLCFPLRLTTKLSEQVERRYGGIAYVLVGARVQTVQCTSNLEKLCINYFFETSVECGIMSVFRHDALDEKYFAYLEHVFSFISAVNLWRANVI